jgi:hypothetical protein
MNVQTRPTEYAAVTLASLHDVIVASAQVVLAMQQADGSMPPGHNGPYHDPETPVRNTSHWALTFLKAWEISGDKMFENAARHAVDYLMRDELRPQGYTFVHRKKANKDACNGVIGDAWTVEALVTVGDKLGIVGAVDLATQVFLVNPFDDERGLWRIIETDGRDLGLDMIFNHQLWFAAAGGLLVQSRNQDITSTVGRFLDQLESNLTLYPDGLIKHFVGGRSAAEAANLIGRTKIFTARLIKRRRLRTLNDDDLRYRAIGYHSFNLYAFGMLAEAIPDHPFWRSEKFLKVLHYVDSISYRDAISQNKYGYPYNPPGFEVPYAMRVFSRAFVDHDQSGSKAWVSEQLRRCFNFDSRQMSSGTTDPLTHAARLYEAIRLPDVSLTLGNG